MVILEINLRRKWTKDLPNLNIVLEKYTDEDEFFNPIQFLEEFDNKKHLELLADWKRKNEKYCLQIKPWLNRLPIQHAKVWIQSPREAIRG